MLAVLIGLDPQALDTPIITIYSVIISLAFPLGGLIGRVNDIRYDVGVLFDHNNLSHDFYDFCTM